MSYDNSSEPSLVNLVNPSDLGGMAITGESSKSEYKRVIPEIKKALQDTEYVFASICQVLKKNVVENPYPTLAIAFDEKNITSVQEYQRYTNEIATRITNVMKLINLPINLIVLDRRDKFLNPFKEPSAWLIDVKDEGLFKTSKPWWKIW